MNEEKVILTCPKKNCQQKLRLPKMDKVLRVSCPECGVNFRYKFPHILETLKSGIKVLSVTSLFSQQPEDKLISMSRIKVASCPYRYFKEYIEKPKDRKPFETIEAGMGRFFHSYVQNHLKKVLARNGIISEGDILDLDDLITNFRLSFLWEGCLRKPYKMVRSHMVLEEFVSRLGGVTRNYNRFLRDKLVDHKVKAIEGNLQIRTDSFYIRGKHDLITENTDGSLMLWDWKTGSSPKPDYYEDFRNQKIQLGIYAIWMRYRYHTPAVCGTAVFLRDECVSLSETFTTDVEQEVLTYAHTWRRQMNTQESYSPIPNNLCDWCGWNPVCQGMSVG